MTSNELGMTQNDSEEIKTLQIEGNLMKVSVGSSSVIGKRNSQQDAVKADSDYVYAEEGKGIAILCDGMGGLSGGEKASNLCAEMVHKMFHEKKESTSIAQFYAAAITKADEAVAALCDANGNPMRAGTTMVSVVIDNGDLHWASVGDSRIYIQRGVEMVQLTQDHNYLMLLNQKVKNGQLSQEEADSNPKKEALISYIGINGVQYVSRNATPLKLVKGDHIILCSDGLYRSVTEEELKQIMLCFRGDMESAAEALTQLALSKGKRHQDNTSVIVLEYQG